MWKHLVWFYCFDDMLLQETLDTRHFLQDPEVSCNEVLLYHNTHQVDSRAWAFYLVLFPHNLR